MNTTLTAQIAGLSMIQGRSPSETRQLGNLRRLRAEIEAGKREPMVAGRFLARQIARREFAELFGA